MTWKIEFLEEAKKDLLRLNHSTQIQVLKGISKVAQNPLPDRLAAAPDISGKIRMAL